MDTKPDILEWLLEPIDISVRYRTLSELLNRGPKDREFREAKAAIPGSPAVTRLFTAMLPDGSWNYAYRHKRSRYLFFVMTSLGWAAELGLDRTDERVTRAVRHLFSLQSEDGDFNRHYSCYNGLILRTLNRLGFGLDSHTVLLRRLLKRSARHDGGFHCDIRPRRKANASPHKSCIKGSIAALLAFAEDKHLRRSEQTKPLADYFLRRHVLFRTDDLRTPVLDKTLDLSFPFTYTSGLVEAVYALALLGYGNRHEMKEAWSLLASKRDEDSRLPLERSVVWPHVSHTPRRRPSKWLTLYACLAEKARNKG
ncbi:MAG TPA: hypothetical protein VMZ92_09705 [Planctomycetota bacterium]|nr:hypothetical protein [Planctomycetota bacterium]